jgi:hypothetical protein
MKTLFNYILPIERLSTWKDPDGKYIIVESSSWFNNYNLYPTISFYYLTENTNYTLILLDRYSFCKFMTKI